MLLQIRSATFLTIAGLLLAGVAAAQNGVVLAQELNASNQGYTVLRVWGSHYEMGYAQANLLGAGCHESTLVNNWEESWKQG